LVSVPCIACRSRGGMDWTRARRIKFGATLPGDKAVVQCRASLLHLFARRGKRKCGAAGSEPVNASGSEAAAGAPDTGPALSNRAVAPRITHNNAPTGNSRRTASHGSSCDYAQRSIPPRDERSSALARRDQGQATLRIRQPAPLSAFVPDERQSDRECPDDEGGARKLWRGRPIDGCVFV